MVSSIASITDQHSLCFAFTATNTTTEIQERSSPDDGPFQGVEVQEDLGETSRCHK